MQTEIEQLEETPVEETPVEELPVEAPSTEEEIPAEQTTQVESPEEEEALRKEPPEDPLEEEETSLEETYEEDIPQEEIPDSPKKFYKTPAFWTALIGGLTCLCALIFIIAALAKPQAEPDPTVPTTAPTVPTETTEPTLPLPEANPIAIGDFAMMGGYLTCLSTESVLGIDVSEWQGSINWQKVKETGIEYAMIRVGYRGTESGDLYEDIYAQANYAGAAAAGIKVGVYFFSQAITVEEALEEADYMLNLIKDWQVEMPVVYDWEYYSEEARTAKMDIRTLTDCTIAFCDAVKNAGYEPMVYFNISHSLENVYIRELTAYKFWLARYDTVLTYPFKIDMWQYTDQGSVPGISTNVDINLYFPWKDE